MPIYGGLDGYPLLSYCLGQVNAWLPVVALFGEA